MRSPKRREEQPMRKYYVGLDVHSKNRAFVIEDEGGKVIARGEVPTTLEGFSQLQATYQLTRRVTPIPYEKMDPEIQTIVQASDEALGGSEWIQYFCHPADLYKHAVVDVLDRGLGDLELRLEE
jgi:hypothetical protein